MQNKEISKLDDIPEQPVSQTEININNPPIKINNVINSSKNIRKTNLNDKHNLNIQENYIKRNSPMQSIKTMFNLNLKKDEKINISNSFFQDFSPKIDNNYFPLTPQILPNDQKFLNKKYFPSKANVCKGNPDSNPKFIIPTSSPIVEYFSPGNIDNVLGADKGFSLENGNSNCFGERISRLSNISQSDMFNCSPSEFFNRTSYGVGSEKNIDGFLISEVEGGEDDKNKSPKEDDDLFTVELEMGNIDIHYKDDDNSIVNKINEMKNKKLKEKMNVNNSKVHKNSYTNKNSHHHKIKKKDNNNNVDINNKEKNVNMPIQNIIESRKKVKKKSKEVVNNANNKNSNTNNNPNNTNNSSNDKNINDNNNNSKNEKDNAKLNKIEEINLNQKNNNNPSFNEDNNNHLENSQNISTDFSKKFEDYIDHFEESPQENNQKNEENYDTKNSNNNMNNFNNKNNTEISNHMNNNIKNINTNNLENENKNLNNFNIYYINQMKNNNLNNNANNNNSTNNLDKNNLNYIKGMNIRCTNLNINNFTNLNNNNNNNQNGNYYDQNQQLLNYLQNQNNQNNFMFNQNPNLMINDIYNINNNIPNINNFNNNYYQNLQRMNLYNMNIMNQINPMNMNTPFYLQNNLIPGYPYFSNNNMNNNQNNIDLIKNKGQKNINNNSININKNQILNNNLNNKNINNQNQGNNNNNLEQQKKKKIKRLETSSYVDKPLSYIAENFSMMGKDQGACRYIQKLLNDNPVESINALYVPLCNNILQLINDPFGNYLIQKIITFLNDEQLYEILKIISPFFFEICCNTHGTRVLQKLVEHSTAPKVKQYFFELLKPLITPLLKQLNGTFVVQKFAEVNNKEYSKEINEIIVENSPVLSTHRHGCCVIQKYLELKDPTMTPNLLDKLIDNCLLLIIDQFGNYVIQTILLMGDKKYGNRLAEKIAENVVYYAKHKYSSNVVEKCFDYCDGIYLQNLMNNVQKKDNLTELILDEHGNYVVQKVLSLSNPKVQKSMLRIIVPLFEKLKNFSYGERVINRLLVSYPIINDNNLFVNDSDTQEI